MTERRYSLRTCLLIWAGLTAASWVLILGVVWLAWPKAGGWSPIRPPEECRLLRGDVLVRIRPYAEAKQFCGWLGHNNPACASVGSDPKTGMPWVIITPASDPDDAFSLGQWALAFEHEASGHGLCSWAAEHPK